MEPICSENDILTVFSGNNSFLDGKIEKIEISKGASGVRVSIDFIMRKSSKYDCVKLYFYNCKEYEFYYKSTHFFYNVELIKLHKEKNGMFYLCFDPANEDLEISEDDTDFIMFEKFSAYSRDP